MRKRYRVLALAALVAALAVPLGFALSPTTTVPAAYETRDASLVTSVAVPTPLVGQRGSMSLVGTWTTPINRQLMEAAKLMLVGTLLIGVAAVVRRAG